MTIRVLLVDDQKLVRAGVHALLDQHADLEVVGEAGSAQALQLAHDVRPDVLVTDLVLSDLDGIALTQHIRTELPCTEVVVLTGLRDEDGSIVHAIRAGAIGYVSKGGDSRDLLAAIRSAAGGRVRLSTGATACIVQELRSPSVTSLTDRERQVLRKIGDGLTNKEIARSLRIAETTVKSHVRAILDKLGVQSRTQAALHVARSGIRAA